MLKSSFFGVLLCFILSACVKNLDLEQAGQIVFSPTLETSLLFFDEPATFFVDDNTGEEIVFVSDAVIVEVFNDSFLKDNLQKVILVFQITNTINRAFEVKIDFLNETEELEYTFSFNTVASVNNLEVLTESTEVFEANNLEAFKATNKLVFTLTLFPSLDGTTLNNESLGTIGFKSKAAFFLNINTGE